METQNELKLELEEDVEQLIKKEDLDSLNKEAESMIHKMDLSDANNLESILDQFGNLGAREQSLAGESLNNLRRPVKSMFENKNNHDVPDNLLKLRQTVRELDPSSISEKGIVGLFNKILRKNPLDKYMAKYQSVDENIKIIVKGLLRGQDKLQEDNADLELIKRDALEMIYNLKKQIYFGKHLFQILEQKRTDPQWAKKISSIIKAQEKIIVRTKNMMTNVNVLYQALSSVDIIKENNDKLKEAIRNAIDTTKNILPVSAMIQMSLSNQRKVINVLHSVNEETEIMIAANARMLKENTEDTTKLLEGATISIEVLQKSFNDIYSAIETQEESSRRIIEKSKEFVDEMDKLNTEIERKIAR